MPDTPRRYVINLPADVGNYIDDSRALAFHADRGNMVGPGGASNASPDPDFYGV